MLSKEQREEIKRRADAATPGEWVAQPYGKTPLSKSEPSHLEIVTFAKSAELGHRKRRIARSYVDSKQVSDLRFMAHARQDIPALLKTINELEAALQAIQQGAATDQLQPRSSASVGG